jgi:hypothetical protein
MKLLRALLGGVFRLWVYRHPCIGPEQRAPAAAMLIVLWLVRQHSMRAPRHWLSSCCASPSSQRLQCCSMPTRSTPSTSQTPFAPPHTRFSSVQAGCPAFRPSAVRVHPPEIAAQFRVICVTSLPHNPRLFGICTILTAVGWCAHHVALITHGDSTRMLFSRPNIFCFVPIRIRSFPRRIARFARRSVLAPCWQAARTSVPCQSCLEFLL